MKQFQYRKPDGSIHGPYLAEDASDLIINRLGSRWIASAEVGAEFIDTDGDVWVRLPDAASTSGPSGAVVTAAVPYLKSAPTWRDERLERIALEYVRILLPAHINGLQLDCTVSEAAVRGAKALIAELDKQA